MVNLLSEIQVYSALKGVFKGAEAQIRKPKKVRELITRHQHHSTIRNLLKNHDINDVSNIAGTLLKDQVFERACIAKTRFLAEQSPISSLDSVDFPFAVQHLLLVNVQSILEKACYSFAQKKMQSVLKRKNWPCPESVELNCWSLVFLDHQHQFGSGSSNGVAKSPHGLFRSMIELRHTTVHRNHITADQLEQFIIDSESLAKLLQDSVCINTLSAWRRKVQFGTSELKRKKDHLKSKLAEYLRNTSTGMAELERVERYTSEIIAEYEKHKVTVGASLEQAIMSTNIVVEVAKREAQPNEELDQYDSFTRLLLKHQSIS